MTKPTQLLKLIRDRNYTASVDRMIFQVCKQFEDKDAISEKLIAIIEPCETEDEALEAIVNYYPISE